MKLLPFLLLTTISASLSSLASAEKPFYIGSWQSNEKMTLDSVAKTKGIPEEVRENMQHNYYGKLVNEFREDSFTTYFIGQKPAHPQYVKAEYKVVGKNRLVVTYFHSMLDKKVDRELVFNNNCYALEARDWHYKEYFCKVAEEAEKSNDKSAPAKKLP